VRSQPRYPFQTVTCCDGSVDPRSSSALDVEITPIGRAETLETEWRLLEASASASFFQSWVWIGAQLEALPETIEPNVLRVFGGKKLVGLGLLWPRKQRRHGFIVSKTMHLNETGSQDLGGFTMEHNGLLTARGWGGAVTNAALGYLHGRKDWDELYLSGLTSSDQALWSEAAYARELFVRTLWKKHFYYIDLKKVRTASTTYLESLGSSTRYNVRRAIRLYTAHGELICEHANSAKEAHEWLLKMAHLHQEYWIAKRQSGAFSTEFSLRFHAALISKGWPSGNVEILRVRVASDVLGYVYNFAKGMIRYNYQSGHAADGDSRLKAGLVCHTLAVEDALRRGVATYDLLMGGDHFKRSLTNAAGSMVWSVIQQRRINLRLEDMLRGLRDKWVSVGASQSKVGDSQVAMQVATAT
jgi:CelD/BcsL family acetyltransferase involved in cellulose biosynthesis